MVVRLKPRYIYDVKFALLVNVLVDVVGYKGTLNVGNVSNDSVPAAYTFSFKWKDKKPPAAAAAAAAIMDPATGGLVVMVCVCVCWGSCVRSHACGRRAGLRRGVLDTLAVLVAEFQCK